MARIDPKALWLAGPLFMALLPQATYLPAWVSALALSGLLWRVSPYWRRDAPGQRLLRYLLIPVAVIGVLLQHHTVFGPRGGVSLLVLMAILKLLESEGRRDHAVMILTGYFLLMTVFIHDQRLPTAAWLALTAIVLTASLTASQSSAWLPPRRALKLAGGLMLQALPMAVLLFVLFPRFPSPIGGLIQAGQALTGLSNSMSPGSISHLIRSRAVAFRVDFAEAGIDGRKLYWRGPVLWYYDGRTWRRGRHSRAQVALQGLGQPLKYTVTLEATDQRWLPTPALTTRLDLPRARQTADLEWLAAKPVTQRLRYSGQAWLDYRSEPQLSPGRRVQALELPTGFNPRALALGRHWAATLRSPQAIVEAALTYFRQQPFHYTLNPPPLGRNAVDDFLFDNRRGFCEHYSSAFAVLMRAAGVPTRVVTGYQGGELNPIGNYWIVRQLDAHAWDEVWLAGRGWVRVDPTAAVAPNRIDLGLQASLPAADLAALDLPTAWLRPMRQVWDFIDNDWNQWVLGYDYARQQQLLNALSPSLADLRGMLWAMLAGIALLLGGLSLWLLRPGVRARLDSAARAYDRFLRRLAKIGLAKGEAEGARDFARRAVQARPDLAPEIEAITSAYVGLRYGAAPPEQLTALRRLVNRFKLRAKSTKDNMLNQAAS